MKHIETISLDEAIKHCLEVAEKYEEGADKDRASEEADNCLQCATDHKQLAEWLQELKCLRGIEQKIYDELAFLYGSPCNFSPQSVKTGLFLTSYDDLKKYLSEDINKEYYRITIPDEIRED